MKPIINIIKEELLKLVSELDVGGKYFNKLVKQSNNIQEPESNYTKPSPEYHESMGEHVGIISVNDDEEINIYANPKSLQYFEPSVRAMSDKNGNLFVAQYDDKFYHEQIGQTINDNSDITNFNMGNPYKQSDNVTWHRVNNTNDFGYSVTYRSYAEVQDENYNRLLELIEIIKRKNPQFNFIPKYWEYIKVSDVLI